MKEEASCIRYTLISGQLFLLIMSTVAIAFIIGESQPVSAWPPWGLRGVQTPAQAGSNLELEAIKKQLADQGKSLDEIKNAIGSKPTDVTPPGDDGIGGFVEKLWSGRGAPVKDANGKITDYGQGVFETPILNHLLSGVMWGAVAGGITYMVAGFLGADDATAKAASLAVGIGTAIGRFGFLQASTPGAGSTFTGLFKSLGFANTGGALLWTVGISAVIFVLLYKKEKKKTVELQCLPWEAPIGGSDCERCNQDPLKPCSEYRCKSLGQACELVNKGSLEERCVWVARNDVNSPTITPWRDVLTPRHQYAPLQTRPTALGTKIVSDETTSKCIKPFTALQFGVVTNEPSQCKIDTENNKTFDEMAYYFGESNLFRYNHTQQLRLPSPDSFAVEGEGIDVPTEGLYNFYVRCQDANGNVNVDEFVFNLCVDKSPDATPPVIEETSITSGSPVSFGTQTVPLTVYLNEPAECKWSIQDKAYASMENNMSCSTHVYEQNARQQYPCQTNLTGVRDNAVNAFFFRCKDQPLKNESERNVNQQSYPFTLRGSQVLSILNVGPNGTFTGGTDVIALNLTVRTDDGSDEGTAICSFSSTGTEGTFIGMFQTNSYVHTQTLSLGAGNYTYFFRCVDAGGNAATANTTFRVVTDRTTPRITRLYHESDILRVITDEDATCAYSLTSCNYVFDEGIEMIILNSQLQFIHAAPWRPQQTYYIKCRDDYGNMPSPNACSVIASASNVF